MTRSGASPQIAIIGMACRFPGADNVRTFWSNLCAGTESIAFFSDAELLAAGVDPSLLANPNYVKAAPILSDVDSFDASFFGYSPREAAIIDPQHRLFLEVAREAFEDAGYHPDAYDGAIGVFAGGGGVVTSYLMAQSGSAGFPGQTAGLPHLGNDKDFLSTRVSYKLNLTGPSVTVQTACSTSLVAVHLACQSLRSGDCDMVLAGAATVRIPHVSGYLAEKGNVYSVDGHSRAFDAAGQGTIFGSGVAAVVLKDLERALADGDHVYAVIKGTAVNNDGGHESQLQCAQRDGTGPGDGESHEGRRDPARDRPVCRVPCHRHRRRRSPGDPGSDAGLCPARTARAVLCHRLRQDQHRAPGTGGRPGRTDQDRPRPPTRAHSPESPLRCPEPGDRLRSQPLPRQHRAEGVARRGWSAPRRRQLTRDRGHECLRGAGRSAARPRVDSRPPPGPPVHALGQNGDRAARRMRNASAPS